MTAEKLRDALVNVVLNPLAALLFGVALIVFIWGLVEFLWGLSTDTEGKEDGKRHMLWGIIGMFVMIAAGTIIKIIANTITVPLPR
ncbi:MAG: hypothetical protein AAB449_03505 [Patescibacteria group bacterium]